MIISLAQTLKLDVVADGVETEGQAAFLKACGCPTAQGYFYSRPQPAAEFEKWLRERDGARSLGSNAHEAQHSVMGT